MHKKFPESQKDELLRDLLQHLAARGIARRWATSRTPYSDILHECHELIRETSTLEAFRIYLAANPIIQQTVETLLSHLAMAANVKWQDAPALIQPIARRGWHIGRWIPTFLIVDGPLGRLLRNAESPLNSILRREFATYPTLSQARDIFSHDLFRQVRNGVGHWSFFWEETDNMPHLVAFSVIEALDRELFSQVNPKIE